MAFGLLVLKWRIFHTPINVKLCNLQHLLMAACKLHNFCIDNRDSSPIKIVSQYKVPSSMRYPHEPTQLGYIPTDAPNVISREGTSHLREVLANRVGKENLSRPMLSQQRRFLEEKRNKLYEQ